MDETMTTLLPCPFCGGRASHMDDPLGGWVECMTTGCHAMGPNGGTARDAALGWNRRTPTQARPVLPQIDGTVGVAPCTDEACIFAGPHPAHAPADAPTGEGGQR